MFASADERAGAGHTFDRLFAELEPVGRDPATGGYRRLVLDEAERTMREWFVGQAQARSLDVQADGIGNLWAWWGDPSAGDALVTGSHLDSVRQGGAFDGPLGIISAFAAVDVLRARGVTPTRPLGVVAFADEEGARFGIACAGSRLFTGLLAPDRALALTDDDGRSLAEALRAAGMDPRGVRPDPELVGRIGAFVELHVEQGRGLIDLGHPVALGSAIRPHGRWRFDLVGRADHAGTTRIADRDDPMLAQARLVFAARDAAERHGAVATVGRVLVQPNGVNAIPSRVRAWLDARADTEETVAAMVAEVAAEVGLDAVEESWTQAVVLDADLRRRLAAGLAARSWGDVPVLPTGAGHDAGILAAAGVPTAMLFVRNPTGTSHAPEEHAERDDCVTGVAALADCLAALL